MAAHLESPTATCSNSVAPAGSHRGLTQAECLAYARKRLLSFIGIQREPNEFAGCVVWNERTVEYNEHPKGKGCMVKRNGGACLCTPA